jgi:hypothetical protein
VRAQSPHHSRQAAARRTRWAQEAWARDQGRRQRFTQEARAASALNHPSVVTIYDISEADDVDFIAMELVETPCS